MALALDTTTLLPWSRREADEGRYVRIQTMALGVVMLLAAIIPHLPVFLDEIAAIEEEPPVVRLTLIPRKLPPPPVPQGGGETAKPDPAPSKTAAPNPAQAQRPRPQQPASAESARNRAARAGVMSAARELQDLHNSAVLTRIQGDRPLIGAVSAQPEASPELLVSGAERGSGGISTSGVGQATGGGTALREGSTGTGTGSGNSGRGSGGTGAGTGGGTGGQGSYQPKRSSESIQLVFDRNKAAFESLYQRALRHNPALQGAVVFELTIQPSGKVSACRVVSSELNDAELESKLVSRILLLDFGAEDVPAITVVNPLRFYPR